MDLRTEALENRQAATDGEGSRSWLMPVTGILAVVFVFLLLYLPFINKAFHIDDLAFINLSRMIGWNPLQAIPVNYDYIGLIIPNALPYDTTHPILVPYIIKVFVAIFGENEIALHLAFAIFPLIAVFSLIKLNTIFFPGSRRVAIILALFFCSVPAFLVNAQNIMTDVPTLAFLFLALAGLLDGFESGSRRMIWLGSAALTLAVFSSYQMLAFVVLIFLYAFWKRKLTLQVTLATVFPVLALLGWLVVVFALYDVFPLFKSKLPDATASIADEIKKGLVPGTLIGKIFSIFAFTGAAMIWVVPLHYALKRALGRFFLFFFSLLIVCYLATFKLTGYPFAKNLFFSVFVALGILTLVTLVWSVRQHIQRGEEAKGRIFLLVWVFCVIGYCIALLPFSSARYLLPLFPPALMLLMNDPAWSFTTRSRRIGLSCALCGAFLFAMASAYSDYKYADSYRDFAAKTKEFRASGGNTFNVWYIGEWGMHYYMDKAGARYLHKDSNEPAPGDYVVLPEMPRLWLPSKQVEGRLAFFGQTAYRSWLPLRLFNRRSQAGFYAHFWGMLPFAFSSEPDEVFQVFKVVK